MEIVPQNIKLLNIMLQIHVGFTGDNIPETMDIFLKQLKSVIDSSFCFLVTDDRYNVSSSSSELFIRFDLGVGFTVKFISSVVDISYNVDNAFVKSILYTL